jgi:hypothetical protein
LFRLLWTDFSRLNFLIPFNTSVTCCQSAKDLDIADTPTSNETIVRQLRVVSDLGILSPPLRRPSDSRCVGFHDVDDPRSRTANEPLLDLRHSLTRTKRSLGGVGSVLARLRQIRRRDLNSTTVRAWVLVEKFLQVEMDLTRRHAMCCRQMRKRTSVEEPNDNVHCGEICGSSWRHCGGIGW